jgi:hypothetical protein
VSEKTAIGYERGAVYAFRLKLAIAIFPIIGVKGAHLVSDLARRKNSCVSFDFGIECGLLAVSPESESDVCGNQASVFKD